MRIVTKELEIEVEDDGSYVKLTVRSTKSAHVATGTEWGHLTPVEADVLAETLKRSSTTVRKGNRWPKKGKR